MYVKKMYKILKNLPFNKKKVEKKVKIIKVNDEKKFILINFK